MQNIHTHVIVGMSGGVDSSVSALLLQQQGYQVAGLFMKNWEEDDTESYCSASIDVQDAQTVCDKLAIPLHTVNFATEYWDKVFTHFLAEYQAGRTPNPDILCNKEIKFNAFLQYAQQLNGNFIATGHYAQVKLLPDGSYALYKGLDPNKDQSYFLYTLGQAQLAKSLFPVGQLAKDQVRKLAAQAGFVNHAKKDSTGICFIGERRFKTFLNRYLPAQPGLIKNTEGTVLGQHDGLMFYTLGQRQGIGIGGLKSSDGSPWYVVAKDLGNNVLIVGQGHDHPWLYHNTLECQQLHWVSGDALNKPLQCSAKIRYRQQEQACQVIPLGPDHCRVIFETPQWAMTPGQAVVFYQAERCLGGATITAND